MFSRRTSTSSKTYTQNKECRQATEKLYTPHQSSSNDFEYPISRNTRTDTEFNGTPSVGFDPNPCPSETGK